MKRLLLGIGLVSLFSSSAFATSPYGANFSYLLIGKDPSNMHAYRASFQYEPPSWVWEHVHVFFDGGYGHWWVNTNNPAYYSHSLSIYSLAPVLRYYFVNRLISPFLDLSIGLSYLTKTHFGGRNLGIHFSFQDQIGVGASFGQDKRLSLSLSAIHYSNGSMSSRNSGITAPLMLNISYRF